MKWRRLVLFSLLLLWLLSGLLLTSSSPFKANSIQGVASPYLFSLARWEAVALWDRLGERVGQLYASPTPSPEDAVRLVEAYLRLGQEIQAIQFRLQRGEADPNLSERLSALHQEREAMRWEVQRAIERQMVQVMKAEGISLLPPLLFEFYAPPNILVVSPRERIVLKEAILLEPWLALETASEIERRVEGLGLSALVEELGGVATYPSLIPEGSSLEFAFSTIAHEWVHQYLFFHPLGRRYEASYEMTTINETVADMVGRELGARVLRLYGREPKKEVESPTGFSFNREMRQTRLAVDDYLAQGQVAEAERFMEERRQFLVQQGYALRRLNQAYFAFHGAYAESPASTSPVARLLRAVREQQPSLSSFLRVVSGISSYEELESLAAVPAH